MPKTTTKVRGTGHKLFWVHTVGGRRLCVWTFHERERERERVNGVGLESWFFQHLFLSLPALALHLQLSNFSLATLT